MKAQDLHLLFSFQYIYLLLGVMPTCRLSKSFKCRSMSMTSMKIVLALIFLMSMLQNSDAQNEDYCIADEQTSEDQLLGTMIWACSNGANCSAIQENRACFFPNTTKDHASYAFNSYYQNMKHLGGGCFFNFAALMTEDDPSHDSCKFEYVP